MGLLHEGKARGRFLGSVLLYRGRRRHLPGPSQPPPTTNQAPPPHANAHTLPTTHPLNRVPRPGPPLQEGGAPPPTALHTNTPPPPHSPCIRPTAERQRTPTLPTPPTPPTCRTVSRGRHHPSQRRRLLPSLASLHPPTRPHTPTLPTPPTCRTASRGQHHPSQRGRPLPSRGSQRGPRLTASGGATWHATAAPSQTSSAASCRRVWVGLCRCVGMMFAYFIFLLVGGRLVDGGAFSLCSAQLAAELCDVLPPPYAIHQFYV